jgi:isopenicillin N synthase-like dioxygenase
MKAAVAAFYELPLEEKSKYAMAEDDIQGYGQVYVVSEHQKLDWCDIMVLMTLPPEYKKMKYWPVAISGFKYVFSVICHRMCVNAHHII